MASKIINLLLQVIQIYSYILMIWVIGSWFPQFTVTKFYQAIDKIVFPYIRLFRGLIPPLGGFDLSIIVAFIVLQYVISPLIVIIGSLFITSGA